MFWRGRNICGPGDSGDVIVQDWEEGQVGHLHVVIMDRAELFADSLCTADWRRKKISRPLGFNDCR
jgi:hypothetical protein